MKIKKNVMKIIQQGAIKNINDSVSTTCLWFCYQPKAPRDLKKIKTK